MISVKSTPDTGITSTDPADRIVNGQALALDPQTLQTLRHRRLQVAARTPRADRALLSAHTLHAYAADALVLGNGGQGRGDA